MQNTTEPDPTPSARRDATLPDPIRSFLFNNPNPSKTRTNPIPFGPATLTPKENAIRPDLTRPDPTEPVPTQPDPTQSTPLDSNPNPSKSRPDPSRPDPTRRDPIRTDDRLRIRQAHPFQEGRHCADQVVHALRNARLPRARAGAVPRPRQGRGLLGLGLLPVRAPVREDPLYGPATSGDIQEGHPQRALFGVPSGVSMADVRRLFFFSAAGVVPLSRGGGGRGLATSLGTDGANRDSQVWKGAEYCRLLLCIAGVFGAGA